MQKLKIQGTHFKKEISCPSCNSFFSIDYFCPDGHTPSVRYSDGQTDITDIIDPKPLKRCAHCGFVIPVEFNTHKKVSREGLGPTTTVKNSDDSTDIATILDPYLYAIVYKKMLHPGGEFLIRKHIWWLLNNQQSSRGSLSFEHHQIQQENLHGMLDLIDKHRINAPLIKAEAFRNLGQFGKCLATIWSLPPGQHTEFVDKLSVECKRENHHRIIISEPS
ncbi:hypothetical protein [Marinilabilia sp.]